MPTISATVARANLYRVIDETAESHEPAHLTVSLRNKANFKRAAKAIAELEREGG